MALGRKTGGRQKGTRNKRTLATERQAQKRRAEGIDPMDYISGVLKGDVAYDEIKYKAAFDLMPYCHPKLASTEVKGDMEIVNYVIGATMSEEDAKATPSDWSSKFAGKPNGNGAAHKNGSA